MTSQPGECLDDSGAGVGEREAIRALLGRNPERYLRTYDRMRASGRARVLGWCWSGLAFGPTFAFYRRLYPVLLTVEGALSLAAGAAVGLAVMHGWGLADAVFAAFLACWGLSAAFYALLGRSLVVGACLERLSKAPAGTRRDDAAWSGPLLRYRRLLILVLVASVVLRAVLGALAPEPAAGASSFQLQIGDLVAPFTGVAALDVPLAMVLGSSLCLVTGWLVWRRARREGVVWPCSGAVAAGVAAALIASQLSASLPVFAGLFPDGQRVFATNYLWIAPIEEGCKLVLLAWIFLPAEPIADRRGAIAATFLVAVGFELVETFIYLGAPYNGLVDVAGRALPRHLLFAAFTAVGLAWYVGRRHLWILAGAWLAATLAHAAYNVAVLILDANLLPADPDRSMVLEQMFGLHPDRLTGAHWLAVAWVHLVALGLALAGAALILRRMLAPPHPGLEVPSPAAASG
jgi:RsiW-degrading membrane proteinase PrsW (M82 family)